MIMARRWAVVTWWAVIARAVHDRAFNHICRLVINRWRRRCVIHRRWRYIHWSRGRVDGTGGHGRANHAAYDCTDYCRSTPAWSAAMGFSLACEGEGT